MPIRTGKKLDLSQLALRVVQEATGEADTFVLPNPKRASSGKKGGLKTMEKLTPEQRKELSEKMRQAKLEKEAFASKEASVNGHQLNIVN